MEYPGIKVDTVTSGIQRRVKGRIAKTNLNVSLASKIKAKILSKYLPYFSKYRKLLK
jgi:shugoshin-like 2